MAATKLDLNAVWDRSVRLMTANRELMLVIAGIFYFLPRVTFRLFVPPIEKTLAQAASSEQAMAAFNAYSQQYWWQNALVLVLQAAGLVAMLALFGDRSRPTVATAMRRTGIYLLPTVGAVILFAIILSLASLTSALLGGLTGSIPLTRVIFLIMLPAIIYIATRLSLFAPVIAVDKVANPFRTLQESWQLTEGNGMKLLLYYVLLGIAFLVVSWVFVQGIGLLLALLGSTPALVGGAILEGLTSAAFWIVLNASLAAIFQLLKRGPNPWPDYD
ncbi:MAG: glycerophosphoryl diester phosphodiesterase membrane domain-containing protein [Sphingomonadaceae bacterium]